MLLEKKITQNELISSKFAPTRKYHCIFWLGSAVLSAGKSPKLVWLIVRVSLTESFVSRGQSTAGSLLTVGVLTALLLQAVHVLLSPCYRRLSRVISSWQRHFLVNTLCHTASDSIPFRWRLPNSEAQHQQLPSVLIFIPFDISCLQVGTLFNNNNNKATIQFIHNWLAFPLWYPFLFVLQFSPLPSTLTFCSVLSQQITSTLPIHRHMVGAGA